MKRFPGVLAAIAIMAAGAAPAFAADEVLEVSERFSGDTVAFDLETYYPDVYLSVSGPDGYSAQRRFPGGSPALRLSEFGEAPDGMYHYLLSAPTGETEKLRNPIDNGRPGGPETERRLVATANGRFVVRGGLILPPGDEVEE